MAAQVQKSALSWQIWPHPEMMLCVRHIKFLALITAPQHQKCQFIHPICDEGARHHFSSLTPLLFRRSSLLQDSDNLRTCMHVYDMSRTG